MVLGLSLGRLLARQKQFRAHGRLQAVLVLLNIVLIVTIMLPSYRRQVVPNIRLWFQDSYYGMASAHAVLGFAAQWLGLYVLAVAGTSLLPGWLRFSNYKPWMRATLALWWLAFLLGCGTYYVWYVRVPENGADARPSSAAENRVTVTVKNFSFEPAQYGRADNMHDDVMLICRCFEFSPDHFFDAWPARYGRRFSPHGS